MKSYLFLMLAIVFEIIGTTALKASEQFTKPVPGIITVIGYLLAFYFLSHAIKVVPVGIAYAIWSGVGIIFITIIGIVAFKQIPDIPALIGLALIIAGVAVINLFSRTVNH